MDAARSNSSSGSRVALGTQSSVLAVRPVDSVLEFSSTIKKCRLSRRSLKEGFAFSLLCSLHAISAH
ncbi:hypothetical protein AV530_005917 [Patagioenas fasciata monilis]|uniref:Uncharacterized protein n=1 Tax=Patagioenas fasciata monilis TaxID=372326 RepID=A0A1V4JNH5_PATFA|nr:hypothetical protein AV530_005917 [Patagioenas fasciata monilis]